MGAALLIARSRLRANLAATVLLVVLAGHRRRHRHGLRRGDAPSGDSVARLPGGQPRRRRRPRLPRREGEFIAGLEDDLEDEAEVVAGLPGVAAVTRAAAVVGHHRRPAMAAAVPIAANGVPRRARGRISSVGRSSCDGRLPDCRRRRRGRHRRAARRPRRCRGGRRADLHDVPLRRARGGQRRP